jgi:hypothetical protein
VTPPIDAAPVGEGFVTAKFKGDVYRLISIDGAPGLNPPVIKRRLHAGQHTIRFIDPQSSQVLDTQTIDLADGQTITVTEH